MFEQIGQSVFQQINGAASNIQPNQNQTAAEQATEMAKQIIDGLWEQVGNSEIYSGIIAVAKIFLGIGLLIVLYRTYVKVTENRMDYRSIIASFIWPIMAILLLVQPINLQGKAITSSTNMWQISLTLRNMVNTLNDIAVLGLGSKDGQTPVSIFTRNINAANEIEQQFNACDNVPEDVKLSCYQQAAERISTGSTLSDPNLQYSSVYMEQAQNILNQLTGADGNTTLNINAQPVENIANILSNPLVSMGRNLIDPVIRSLLLGLYLMFSLLIEIAMLLVAIVAPIAVGMSLIPLQSNSLITFLSGFMSIGMTKIAFNIIANLAANFSFDSNYSGFNTAVCLMLGVGAPFIAGSVGAFSASAVYQGVSYVGMLAASLGSGTISRVAFLGAARMGR